MRRSIREGLLFGLVSISLIIPASSANASVNDSSVYLPPNYYSFVPPAAGGSYVDPVFGTTISRISNAANTVRADSGGLLQSVEAEYSTKSPFNADNSKVLLVEFSYFALYDGVTLQRIKPLLPVSSSSEPLWSRSDPNVFYFHPYNSNQLKAYNVSNDVQTVVHTFSEYGAISGQGESEMSYDGNHLVLSGDGHQVFVYTISTDTKGPVFDASGKGNLDALYISPNNNVLIAWSATGTGRYQGEELYDINMNFLRQVANNDGHKHITRDTDGSEVLIQTNSADPTPLANCSNGIVKISLATAAQTCLFALGTYDRWTDAVHVTAPDQQGWVFVETYNVSSSASPWYPYTNELLQIALDGSFVRRYAHHRSNTSVYDGQPHISLSRDGSRFTFNSNMMGSTTDVYLVVLSGASVSAGATGASSGGGTSSTGGGTGTTTGTSGSGTTGTGGNSATAARTEQDSSAVRYSGSWFNNSSATFSGGSATQAMDAGSSATFTFTGTAIRWIGYRDEWSGIANVYLDGQLQATVDTYASPFQPQTAVWSVSGLAAASHTLTITVAGSHDGSYAGSWVWIDAFDVDAGNSAPPAASSAVGPQVAQNGVVNGASFSKDAVSAGSITSLFGTNLATTITSNAASALPTTLGGTEVLVNGISAPLFYSSPSQINFQMPPVSTGTAAQVVVVSNGVSGPAASVNVAPAAPGIFQAVPGGTAQGAIQIANTAVFAAPQGSIAGAQSRPANSGELLNIYCTGLGGVTNAPAPGTPASSDPLSTTVNLPQVTIGGVLASVVFSGLAPGFVGLYQVNVFLPAGGPAGAAVPVVLSIDGIQSNTVTIAISGF
jgi:uncharacterized protein (TIGR03437 family)